jgi:hypothetical protein
MLRFQHDHEFRREQLAKSMTGSRLKKALGDAFWSIWWDNANPTLAIGNHRLAMDADIDHMFNVIVSHRPRVIGTLGSRASSGLQMLSEDLPLFYRKNGTELFNGANVIRGRHPNAMGITSDEIQDFANRLLKACCGHGA